MQRRSHGNDRDRKWGKALSRRVAARQDDWGQDGPATDTRLLGAPVRTSTLALIVAAAALLASVGVATGKAHGAKHPQARRALNVRVLAAPIRLHGQQALRVIVRTVPRSRCTLQVQARRSSTSLPSVITDPQGRVSWSWLVPSAAPSGRWTFVGRCRRSGRTGRGADRVVLFTFNRRGGRGALIQNSTTRLQEGRPTNPYTGRGSGGDPYPPGECTYYVWSRRSDLPWFAGWHGDARYWADSARASGFPVYTVPKAGAVVVFQPGQDYAGSVGHVAYVESVSSDQSSMVISEMNITGWGGGWNIKSYRTIRNPAGRLQFIYHRGETPDSPGGGGDPVLNVTFDDVHVYSSDTLAVTPGQQVRATVTARYANGPGAIPCGLANLGTTNDAPVPFADLSSGTWPNSPWRSRNRVAAVGCNGSLSVGAYARWDLTFRPSAYTTPGRYVVGTFGPLWEGRQRSNVAQPIALQVTKTAFAAVVVGQSFTRVLGPGRTGAVTIQLRNTGSQPWDGNVHLATPDDSAIRYGTSGVINGNRVGFTSDDGSSTVAPGHVGTFTYTVQSPAGQAAAFRQRFDLVRDGSGPRFADELGVYIPTVIADPTHWPAELTNADCTWQFVSQATHGATTSDNWAIVTDSQPSDFYYTIKNTSDLCPWFATGTHALHLGTDHPRDRGSGFSDTSNGWLSLNRIAMSAGTTVAPGDTVSIGFGLKAMSGLAPGRYREYFTPVVDGPLAGGGWLTDQSTWVPIEKR